MNVFIYCDGKISEAERPNIVSCAVGTVGLISVDKVQLINWAIAVETNYIESHLKQIEHMQYLVAKLRAQIIALEFEKQQGLTIN